jgi:rubrerythrin
VVAPPRLTRRAFIGAAGASLVALAAGCGGEDAPADAGRADAALLGAMLARERAAAEQLRELAARGGRGSVEIGRARAHDEAHARRLAAELRKLGGRTPTPASPGGAAAGTPVTVALAIKQDLYARYLEEMPLLRTAALRSLITEIAIVEAEHVAALRAASGADPLDDPFPVGQRA